MGHHPCSDRRAATTRVGARGSRIRMARDAGIAEPERAAADLDDGTAAMARLTEATAALGGLASRRLGLTIVLITHEMAVVREICDRVLVLEGGRAVESGPVWRVFGEAAHPATRALLRPGGQALPEDLAARLLPAPRPGRGDAALVALTRRRDAGRPTRKRGRATCPPIIPTTPPPPRHPGGGPRCRRSAPLRPGADRDGEALLGREGPGGGHDASSQRRSSHLPRPFRTFSASGRRNPAAATTGSSMGVRPSTPCAIRQRSSLSRRSCGSQSATSVAWATCRRVRPGSRPRPRWRPGRRASRGGPPAARPACRRCRGRASGGRRPTTGAWRCG